MRVGIVFEYEELALVRKVLAFLHLRKTLKCWRQLISHHMRKYKVGILASYPDVEFTVTLPMDYGKFRQKYIKKGG